MLYYILIYIILYIYYIIYYIYYTYTHVYVRMRTHEQAHACDNVRAKRYDHPVYIEPKGCMRGPSRAGNSI